MHTPHPPDDSARQLQLFDLADRRVLVVGLGASGLAMARWCSARGARLRLVDTRYPVVGEVPEPARSLAQSHEFFGGDFDAAWLEGIDWVCWSPGLSVEQGDSARFAGWAHERAIPIVGELDLFVDGLAQLAQQGYSPKVVAVTGTNGKTTTTALTTLLIESSGMTARAAGNIGPPMLAALEAALAEQRLPEVWVLELSSFQLALCRGFEPDAAAILNLTPDHLDWHSDFESYRKAKRRIIGPSTRVVFNRADPATQPEPALPAVAPRARGRRRPVAETPRHSSFGLDRPSGPGDFGLVEHGSLSWLAIALADDDSEPSGGSAGDLRISRLMPVDALALTGTHNQQNAMAALSLARRVGAQMAPMLRALRDYRGEPHRCQWLARINEVDYFDDSKGTNVGATVAALRGLDRPVLLIAGGEGKGQDFSPLQSVVARHAVAVLLIGRDASLIASAIESAGRPIEYCESLEHAVERAAARATPGQAVLLSPACASFDMFQSYVHRGQAFAAIVQRRADEAGAPMELAC
ncbi:MAG: hypothetical protein RL322_3309 [Pseudomonadota bacterium]|jgi:UDP-N-acetylmuramoylalanine--D-glutamate ligase